MHDYSLLDNIGKGVELLKKHIESESEIYIVPDSDVDGMASAGILFHYIKSKLNYHKIQFLLHTEKQHGLSKDILVQIKEIKNKNSLIILPDAGTNDAKECKKLTKEGFEILVIDHHLKEVDNPHATIINNQTCDYPNKEFCGAGIVYKFLQALDDEYWVEGADDYLDMVAFANISDVMDLRECETKYLVDIGLASIKHPLLLALIEKQSFSIKNKEKPSITDVSFYLTPLINAIVRVGKQEEKEIMFKAFAMEYEEFKYKPRKSKNNPNPTEEIETIYDRVARLACNTKARQGKKQDSAVSEVIDVFDEENKKNAICFVNVSRIKSVTRELTGLIAIKIADRYSKPCLVLRLDKDKSKDDKIIFSGSGRNINNCYIENLKTELEESKLFVEVVGHENAFGVSIEKDKIQEAIDFFNAKYEEESKSGKIYAVDFVFEESVDYKVIKDINSMRNLFSNFVSEPLIAINNVNMDLIGLDVFGTEKKHWKFQDGVVEYIKFNVPKDDEVLNADTFSYGNATLDVVGRTGINTFGGRATPQIIIDSYRIRKWF